jgi:hypothetical protein
MHNIILHDPCAGISVPNREPFLSRGLQEKLMSPYRTELRDFPHFEFKGAVLRDLKLAAEKEIIRPLPLDPEGVIREVEDLKAEGNLYFRRGDLYFRDGTGGASEYWNLALRKIERAIQADSLRSIRESGGMQFLNRLTALSFDLSSNKAQDYLKCMRYHDDNKELMDEFGLKLSDAVWEAMTTTSKYPGSTWRPSSDQMAKLAYRKAVRCRIGGEPLMLGQAEGAIEEALRLRPNDVEIRKEMDRIAQWRRRISS